MFDGVPQSDKAAEARMFWLATSECRRLRRQRKTDPTLIAEHVDEVEVIALHTDWPLLKDRCELFTGKGFVLRSHRVAG